MKEDAAADELFGGEDAGEGANMTNKERMMAAIRGEAVDRIPWVPRLDLWWLNDARNK